MNVCEARAVMAEHYKDHGCGKSGDVGCLVAWSNYAASLVALAEERGYHPQSFPSVRQWMRMNGKEPIPMEEAWAVGR
jgi:hypothetical protein